VTDTEKFPAFPKIPRLHREVVITEKIDGTNGIIEINTSGVGQSLPDYFVHPVTGDGVLVRAGSRNRWLNAFTKGGDNFGFAQWVRDNALDLVDVLGPGIHYGEWWGQGIQRGYGLDHKRFSLFNVSRWNEGNLDLVPGLDVVPTLVTGNADNLNSLVDGALWDLEDIGSAAAPGFMNPEGVVVYHKAGNHLYKVTLEKDEEPKGKNR
jgi:hypothetical protein